MGEQPGALDVAAQTDVGLKRTRNEDTCEFRIPEPNTPQHAHGALFVVADGMGGMGGGDVASRTAITTLFEAYYSAQQAPGVSHSHMLKRALDAANAAVRQKAREVNLSRIGSTASGVLLLPDREALIFNVGDARVYRIRQNFIEQLSHDQSVLQHQIDAGVISETQARQSRNVNVTAFIGQERPLQAIYRRAQVETGDVFLLCSDGLWDLVEPHEMLRIVEQYSAEAATRRLIELARKRGAHDNVTVIVVRIGATGAPRARAGWQILAALLVLALVAGGVWFAFLRGDAADDESPRDRSAALATRTVSATPQASLNGSATVTDGESDTTPTSGAAVTILSTGTPSATPTHRATMTITQVPTVTRTPRATRTPAPTATRTASPSATATARPSATPTQAASATATRTPRPTASPQPSNTPPPSVTPSPRGPTVTVNPDVISPTPSPLPDPTATRSAAQMKLLFAASGGVRLAERTALYLFEAPAGTVTPDVPATPAEASGAIDRGTVERTLTLSSGTSVRVISDTARTHPTDPARELREVEVLSGLHVLRRGWIDVQVLAAANPLEAYVAARDRVVNVRAGDSTAFDIVATLEPGAIAPISGESARRNGWYAIEQADGVQGWVSSAVVDVFGPVDDLPAVTPPALPTPTTNTPQATRES